MIRTTENLYKFASAFSKCLIQKIRSGQVSSSCRSLTSLFPIFKRNLFRLLLHFGARGLDKVISKGGCRKVECNTRVRRSPCFIKEI